MLGAYFSDKPCEFHLSGMLFLLTVVPFSKKVARKMQKTNKKKQYIFSFFQRNK